MSWEKLIFAIFILLFLALGLGYIVVRESNSSSVEKAPITGFNNLSRRFDDFMVSIMENHNVLGGSLAVAKGDNLVLNRGYGWADRSRNVPVKPDYLFRIASLTKPITAVTVLHLCEEGRLNLRAKAFRLLDNLEPPADRRVSDPRIYDITVLDLLRHRAGWKRVVDPMFMPVRIAENLGVPPPADSRDIIRYMMTQPLDYSPGENFSYSNFGYNVLGRVIEAVTGRRYENYVKNEVLEPMGITGMRIGNSLLEKRGENEVFYHSSRKAISVFPPHNLVPRAYGGFYLQAMDSHGGWVGSASDVVEFMTSIDNFLEENTIKFMTSPPEGVETSVDRYYGCGWYIYRNDNRRDWVHTGGLSGSCGVMVRTHDEFALTALFNKYPPSLPPFKMYEKFLEISENIRGTRA